MLSLEKSYEYYQPEKHSETLTIVGCGAVGSMIACGLVRFGLTNLRLFDYDLVEPKNLANQMFRQKDVGKLKVEALAEILEDINDETKDTVKLEPKGWTGQRLNGYVFLAVDNIDTRREICKSILDNQFVKAVFDCRVLLESAQSYAADWSDYKQRQSLLNSMDFSHEDAMAEVPTSACNVVLGVQPTVSVITALCLANFVNFCNGKPLKKLILADVFGMQLDAF